LFFFLLFLDFFVVVSVEVVSVPLLCVVELWVVELCESVELGWAGAGWLD
jgi:hypothetical protein